MEYNIMWGVGTESNQISPKEFRTGLVSGKYHDYGRWLSNGNYPEVFNYIKANGSAVITSKTDLNEKELAFVRQNLQRIIKSVVMLKGEDIVKDEKALQQFINENATDFTVKSLNVNYASKRAMLEDGSNFSYTGSLGIYYKPIGPDEEIVNNRKNTLGV